MYSTNLNVSSLNGINGFSITGEPNGNYYTSSDRIYYYNVKDAGDVNGDNYNDIIIGTPTYNQAQGRSYVIFGKSEGFPVDIGLDTLTGTNGFSITGINTLDAAGFSVGGAGDINRDGYDDLIVGAPDYKASTGTGLDDYGQTYVVFGGPGPFPSDISVATLDGTNGFTIQEEGNISGVNSNTRFGYSVGVAGDVNGDGFADIIVGGPMYGAGYTQPFAGRSYVIFGHGGNFSASLSLNVTNVTNIKDKGFAITGTTFGEFSGSSVSRAGDINGDSFDDLIVGAYGYSDNALQGRSYVIFGKGSFPTNIYVDSLSGTNGFSITGENPQNATVFDSGDRAGYSVSVAGDVNGDGYGDIIIGAPGYYSNSVSMSHMGRSYVVFGKSTAFPANIDLKTLNGNNGFYINGDNTFIGEAGYSVSAAKDVNGDGCDDLLIGAPLYTIPGTGYTPGRSYVVFGCPVGSFPVNVNLGSLSRTSGFHITGETNNYGNKAGASVSGAGDMNGDGFSDLIIGAPLHRNMETNELVGRSYVIFGGPIPSLSPSMSLTQSKTRSKSMSLTETQTKSKTPRVMQSTSKSPSQSMPKSNSVSLTKSKSLNATPTKSVTQNKSASQTLIKTKSQSFTKSKTKTKSRSKSRTKSKSKTHSKSKSQSHKVGFLKRKLQALEHMPFEKELTGSANRLTPMWVQPMKAVAGALSSIPQLFSSSTDQGTPAPVTAAMPSMPSFDAGQVALGRVGIHLAQQAYDTFTNWMSGTGSSEGLEIREMLPVQQLQPVIQEHLQTAGQLSELLRQLAPQIENSELAEWLQEAVADHKVEAEQLLRQSMLDKAAVSNLGKNLTGVVQDITEFVEASSEALRTEESIYFKWKLALLREHLEATVANPLLVESTPEVIREALKLQLTQASNFIPEQPVVPESMPMYANASLLEATGPMQIWG